MSYDPPGSGGGTDAAVTAILADSPLFCFSLDFREAVDASPNNRQLSIRDATGPGTNRGAVHFDAGGFEIADAAWMDVSAITVEVWFKRSAISAREPLMTRDTSSNRAWALSLTAAGAIEAVGNAGTGPTRTSTTSGLDDGNWHHVGWVDGGASGSGFFVIDRVVDATTYSSSGALSAVTAPIRFGSWPLAAQVFRGDLALGAMWGSTLTSAQIQAHYDAVT